MINQLHYTVIARNSLARGTFFVSQIPFWLFCWVSLNNSIMYGYPVPSSLLVVSSIPFLGMFFKISLSIKISTIRIHYQIFNVNLIKRTIHKDDGDTIAWVKNKKSLELTNVSKNQKLGLVINR